jgi:hypothetical protein
MLIHEETPVLMSELELELLDDYPLEVLASGWNPALAQVQLLKRRRHDDGERLIEYLPDPFDSQRH